MGVGTISWFYPEKGFGAIEVKDSSEILFFHHSQIKYPHNKHTIRVNDKVSFDVYESERIPGKLEARNVEKL